MSDEEMPDAELTPEQLAAWEDFKKKWADLGVLNRLLEKVN